MIFKPLPLAFLVSPSKFEDFLKFSAFGNLSEELYNDKLLAVDWPDRNTMKERW